MNKAETTIELVIIFFITLISVSVLVAVLTYQPVQTEHCPRHESGHYTATHPKNCNNK